MSKVNLIIVAKINHDESEALSHYLDKVGNLYKQVEAKSVGKYKISKPLIGKRTPSLVSIMEFSNMESLNHVFDGNEYKELIAYRDKAFLDVEAFISE
ncbi:MAG: DUF1330 domain-containing protein [Algibacter sp.]